MPDETKSWVELPFPIAEFDQQGHHLENSLVWESFVNQYIPTFSEVEPAQFLEKFCKSINETTKSFIEKMLDPSNGEEAFSFQLEQSTVHFLISETKSIWIYFSKNAQSDFSAQLTQKIVENERQKALAELAGSIAHEVNNPMTVVYTKLQMLKVKLASGNLTLDKVEESIDSMTRNTERVVKIIRGMRSLASFNERSSFVRSNISDIVEEALVLLASELITSGVVIKKNLKDENVDIYCQPTQVLQLVIVLLKNAKDATAELSNPEITINLEKGDSFATLSVYDNGPGVDPEIEEKIFSAFYTTKGLGGNGLGLSVAQKIAEKHQGKIFLNREISNSCFSISLPIFVNKSENENSD